MEELRVEDPQSFFNYLRMEPAMFDELVQRVGPRIEKQIGALRLHLSRIQAAIENFGQHSKCIPAEFF